MTKDEIKKALETCADISIPCNDCPYDAVGNCTDTLCADALELIIEQEKEIERLKAEVKQAQIDVLNKLKKRARTSYVLDDFILGSVVFSKDINKLIKEVQNGKDKG